MSTLSEATVTFLTNSLNSILDKLEQLSEPVSEIAGNLTTTKRVVLSGVAVAILLKLYLGKPKKKTRTYITNLNDVGQAVGPQVAVAVPSVTPEYDVIIVGGGTSGCALAARLTENPNIHVLLLEAGGSGRALPQSRLPSAYTQLYRLTEHVHNFWTELQTSANGVKKFWPRAKMLGGCSSINAQMAQYGAPGDFDEWASITGDKSYAWKYFSYYFRKFESYRPNKDFPQVDISVRGTTGPVQVGFNNSVSVWCNKFVESCINAGIPETNDFNGPHGTIGAARIMTYVDDNHERVSSEAAYLTPDVLSRPNLKVAINATVTRVLFQRDVEKTVASGVEFATSEDGHLFQANAKKDVIISAGAVQSPHILLLSGIGPADQLLAHNIPVIHHLPGVGKHLLDHPIVDMNFQQKGYVQAFRYLNPKNFKDTLKVFRDVSRYYIFRTGGPLAMNWGESAAFVRTDDPVLFPASEYPEKLLDSTSSKDSPDLEYFSTPSAYKQHAAVLFEDYHTYAVHVYLVRPTSHGTITLNSSSPFEHPKVDPNYLATREDLVKLVRGVRLGLKIAHQEPLNSLLNHASTDDQFDHRLHLKTDEELEEIVRDRVETVYHPTSSCRMAPLAQGGVVDSKFNVYGIRGLKICDASVFPSIVSGHTAGACFAIAEKLADQIKAEF